MEIHSISKGVTLFSLMLKQVGQTLQASDSVHSSEALETAQEITSECQMVFDEIHEMLDKVTSRRGDGNVSPSIQQKFRWCFKKGRVQYLLAQLESLKMSLLVMLQILQLGKLMAVMPKR
jgi:N-terminal domain on NACHT_NTPase and P-loop NTPases